MSEPGIVLYREAVGEDMLYNLSKQNKLPKNLLAS